MQPCSLSYKRIRQLLITNRSLRSVARIDSSGVVQLEEPLSDRMHEGLEVSSWKIGSADGLVEQGITSKDVTVAGEADAAGGMAWSVENVNRLHTPGHSPGSISLTGDGTS